MTDRDDVLERASESLRELGTPSDEDVARLRARLMASSSSSGGGKGGGVLPFTAKRPVRRTLRWVLPLAAALAAGTALAATPSVYATLHGALVRALPFVFAPREPPARSLAQRPDPRTPAPAPASSAAAPLQPEDASHTPHVLSPVPVPVPERRATRPRPTPPTHVPSPAVPAAPESPTPASEPPELAPFKRAQDLQLRDHDYAAALAAWDAFLARLPQGTLALEARYQRALCLVRLGRRAEAQRALAPFAQGSVEGGYKRAEAEALRDALRALERRTP